MSESTEIRSKIHQNGRINIPAILRHQLHLDTGDDIIFQIQENNLVITTPENALLQFQHLIKKQKNRGDKTSVVDELIAMRRQEAKHD